MFTKQAPQMHRQLVEAGMPDKQANVLLNVLGNCLAALEHRGPVTLDPPSYDTELDTGAPIDPTQPPDIDEPAVEGGALTVINNGYYDTTTNTFIGPTNIFHGGNIFWGDEYHYTDHVFYNVTNFTLTSTTFIWNGITFVVTDIGKVRVNSGDALDYLEDQVFGWTASPNSYASACILFTTTSGKVEARLKPDAISGFSAGTKQALTHNTSGVLEWMDIQAC